MFCFHVLTYVARSCFYCLAVALTRVWKAFVAMEVTLPVFAAFEITKGVKLWLNLEDGKIGVAIFDTTIDKYTTIYLGPPPSEHGAPSLFWNQTMLDAGI